MMRRLLLIALLLLPAACGHKGPVRPLGVPLPAAVRQLTVTQFGGSLVVSWLPPAANQDGSPLQSMKEFAVYRQQFDPQDDCPECRPPKTPVARVAAEPGGDSYRFVDRKGLRPGMGYRYRVVPLATGNLAGEPAQARSLFVEPPAKPTLPGGQALEKLNRLSWQAPAGATPGGYRIERSSGPAGEPFEMLTELPAEQTTYDDFAVKGGTSYRYRVRAFYRSDRGKVYSEAAGPVHLVAMP
ncbi:MAG: hypothetical protein Tsb0017_18490 [Geothermobacteraceae bacterium]